jgi:hypothetical protein
MTAYTTTGSPLVLDITGTNGSLVLILFLPPQKQELTVLCKNYTTLFWTSCHRYTYATVLKTVHNPYAPAPPIEECLIVPRFAFAHIFQLKAYGQYGLHGSVINIPTNLNVVQFVLP